MNDIEHELRELFRERADAVVTGVAAPERVLRRGRRRQVWSVALVSLVSIALVGGSVAGLRGLLGERPAQRPASESSVRIASGDGFGIRWTLSGWIDGGLYCTTLVSKDGHDGPQGVSTSCGSRPAQDRATFTVTEYDAFSTSFLVASVPDDVAEVLVENEEARRFSTRDFVEAPVGWGALRFAVVPLGSEGPGAVHFLGTDGNGAYPSVGFQWDGLPDSSPFGQVYDDVTDEIGTVRLGGASRTLLAWQEATTTKFGVFLGEAGVGSRAKALISVGTKEYVQETPHLAIGPLACDHGPTVLWGTVPGDVEAIRLLHHEPDRIETIAGPPKFEDVRFVLAAIDRPYPGSIWVIYEYANGRLEQEWISGSCLEGTPEPPEA